MFALDGQTISIWQEPTLAEPAMWFLLGLLPLVVIVSRALRVVGEDERLVVRRLGRVAGVRGPGLVVVWPILEREVRVSLRLVCLDLFRTEAVTRDGVSVRVKATAVAAVDDPVRFAMTMDGPLTATTIAAECVLRRQIAQRNLADLPAMVTHAGADMADQVSETARRWGVRVTLLDIADIQVPLRGELIAWARAGQASGNGKAITYSSSPPAPRAHVEQRLRAAGRQGRPARRYGEHGDPDRDTGHTTLAKGDTAPWTSRTPPFRASEPSITATPGKETTSPSSSPAPVGEPCFSTAEPTPTLRRTP
jgi:hypothetical protein